MFSWTKWSFFDWPHHFHLRQWRILWGAGKYLLNLISENECFISMLRIVFTNWKSHYSNNCLIHFTEWPRHNNVRGHRLKRSQIYNLLRNSPFSNGLEIEKHIVFYWAKQHRTSTGHWWNEGSCRAIYWALLLMLLTVTTAHTDPQNKDAFINHSICFTWLG